MIPNVIQVVDFSTALLFARGGYRVFRQGWEHRSLAVRRNRIMVLGVDQKVVREWEPTQDDILAQDWEYEDDRRNEGQDRGGGGDG